MRYFKYVILYSHNTRACARTVAVALNVLRCCTTHVALCELKLAVDVGLIHFADAVCEARNALAVVTPCERGLHDADALFAGGVFDQLALGHTIVSFLLERQGTGGQLPHAMGQGLMEAVKDERRLAQTHLTRRRRLAKCTERQRTAYCLARKPRERTLRPHCHRDERDA